MNHHPAALHPHLTCSSTSLFPDTRKTIRILRLKQVLDRVGISRAQLYLLMGEDRFPKNFSLCGPTGRAVGWRESDVDAWIGRLEQQQKAEAK